MKLKDLKPFKVQVMEEQSRELQKLCFRKGIFWKGNRKNIVQNIEKQFLYIGENIFYESLYEEFMIDGGSEENLNIVVRNNRILHFHEAMEYLNKFEDYNECTGYVRCIKSTESKVFIKGNCYKMSKDSTLYDSFAVMDEDGVPNGIEGCNEKYFEYITKAEYDDWKDSRKIQIPVPPYILKSLAEALGVDVSIFAVVKAEKVGWQTGWDNIPEKYEYRAMDEDGKCCCYIDEPEIGSNQFSEGRGYRKIGKNLYIGDWEESLQKRPNKK